MMNTYIFETKSYVTHEVTIKAKSEEEAWDKFYDGKGKEEEVDSHTYHEDLLYIDENQGGNDE